MAIVQLLLTSITLACCWAQENTVCYEPCGCFSNEEPFNTRPLPESPWEQEITWQLYTRENPDEPENITLETNGSAIIVPPNFDPSRPSKFIIHGWTDGPNDSMGQSKDDYLDYGDFNVFVVDWSVGASRVYLLSCSNTRVVGSCSAAIATTLHDGNLDNVHCVGHSLGAQTCGYMGDSTDGELGRISGLDPAGPYFEYTNNTELFLDSSDAQLVDVLHTDIVDDEAAGFARPTGHVDFYPNKGGRQPGCPDRSCDHQSVVYYYTESIRGSCDFRAFPCESDEEADNCECETCDPDETCQVMGFEADLYPGRGTFFLRTVADAPYCEEEGAGPCAY